MNCIWHKRKSKLDIPLRGLIETNTIAEWSARGGGVSELAPRALNVISCYGCLAAVILSPFSSPHWKIKLSQFLKIISAFGEFSGWLFLYRVYLVLLININSINSSKSSYVLHCRKNCRFFVLNNLFIYLFNQTKHILFWYNSL